MERTTLSAASSPTRARMRLDSVDVEARSAAHQAAARAASAGVSARAISSRAPTFSQ
jgi:hypothetical protein